MGFSYRRSLRPVVKCPYLRTSEVARARTQTLRTMSRQLANLGQRSTESSALGATKPLLDIQRRCAHSRIRNSSSWMARRSSAVTNYNNTIIILSVVITWVISIHTIVNVMIVLAISRLRPARFARRWQRLARRGRDRACSADGRRSCVTIIITTLSISISNVIIIMIIIIIFISSSSSSTYTCNQYIYI